MKRPTIQRLFELFLVPDNGQLFRKPERSSEMEIRQAVGTNGSDGYISTSIDGWNVRVHVIVFAMTRGSWPEGEIDHINGNKRDNRPDNLRDCKRFQNMHNRPKQRNSRSGIRGVHWSTQRRKWLAQIMVNRKVHYLGLFDDPQEAGKAYREASIRLLGEFSHDASA